MVRAGSGRRRIGEVGVAAVRYDGLPLAVFVFDDEVGGIRVGAVDGVQHRAVAHQAADFVTGPDVVTATNVGNRQEAFVSFNLYFVQKNILTKI